MVLLSSKQWSYFNVLEALFARIPAGGYNADVGAWATEIEKLRDEYGQKYPELFEEIHFVDRPPGRPYSRELSDFFVCQAFGGVRQLVNTAYERMEVSTEAQQELLSRNVQLVKQYGTVFDEMASKLAPILGLPTAS